METFTWNNGLVHGGTGWTNNLTEHSYDDFNIGETVELISYKVLSRELSPFNPGNAVETKIYKHSDSTGMPEIPPIATYSSATFEHLQIEYRKFRYDVTLNNPIKLCPGSTYWFNYQFPERMGEQYWALSTGGSPTGMSRIFSTKDGGATIFPAIGILRFELTFCDLGYSREITSDQDAVFVNEGNTATNGNSVSDADCVSLSASIGTVSNNNDGTWSWTIDTTSGPAKSQTVAITASFGPVDVTTEFKLEVQDAANGDLSQAFPICHDRSGH